MKAKALLLLLPLAACGSNVDGINSTKVALTAAEQSATMYIQLPPCPSPTGLWCSEAKISDSIKAADNVAYDGVKALSAGKLTVPEATALITRLVVLIPVKGASR